MQIKMAVTDVLDRVMRDAGVKPKTASRRAVCRVLCRLGLARKDVMKLSRMGVKVRMYSETDAMTRI